MIVPPATMRALEVDLGVDPFDVAEYPNDAGVDPATGLHPCSNCGTRDTSARFSTTGTRWACPTCAVRLTAARGL